MESHCQACDKPDDSDSGMVACDTCHAWFHFSCVGVTSEIANVTWNCDDCTTTLRVRQEQVSTRSNGAKARSTVSSLRSKSSSSVLVGLKLLDEELQAKQQQLMEEKALQEKRLAMEEEFLNKQKQLRERFEEQRSKLLHAQVEATGASSIISLHSGQSSRSKVERWMEKQQNPGGKNTANSCIGDPRGAYPKFPSTKTTTQTSPLRNPTVSFMREGVGRNSMLPCEQTSNRAAKSTQDASTKQYDGIVPAPVDVSVSQMTSRSFDKAKQKSFVRPSSTSDKQRGEYAYANVDSGTNYHSNILSSECIQEQGPLTHSRKPRLSHVQYEQKGAACTNRHITEVGVDRGRTQSNCIPNISWGPHNQRLQSNNIPSVPHGLGNQIESITSAQLAARQVLPKKLPTFTGRPDEWPLFISSYETTNNACGYSSSENLVRLQECLKGPALEAVRSRLLLPHSVPRVIETLRKLYGRPEQLLQSLLHKARRADPPKTDRLESFISFGLVVDQLCDHIEATNLHDHLINPLLVQELVDKLPAASKLEWVRYKRSFDDVTLRTFADFMSQLASDASEVTTWLEPKHISGSVGKKEKGFIHSHDSHQLATAVPVLSNVENKMATDKPCRICQRTDHRVRNCEAFKKMRWDERMRAVNKWKLCSICLNEHGQARCRFRLQCNVAHCRERHHPLLHQYFVERESLSQSNHNTHIQEACPVLFRTIPVTLYNGDKSLDTIAFIDEGSSLSLVEDSIIKQLGVHGVDEPLRLVWTANITRREKNSKRLNLMISARGAKETICLRNVRTVEELKLPCQKIQTTEILRQFNHLKNLQLADNRGIAKILIGVDNVHLFAPLESKIGNQGEPIAVRSILGWTVYGPCNREASTSYVGHHSSGCTTNEELYELIRKYYSVEEHAVSASPPIEAENDKRARAIMERTTIFKDGRYETGLIWRFDDYTFPNSYPMALKRLKQLETRLARNPELAVNVKRQIIEYQQKNYAHKATPEELQESNPNHVWYLPLNVVLNPKKPNKVRLVWDAAATVSGVSLNSMLLKGPDLLTSLLAVLSQFREHRIGFGADIQEMYHQIQIRSSDKSAQRFLFRDDPNQSPDVYIMDVATFGSTCSPSSAQFVKNMNAENYVDSFPDAVKAIVHKHYVDDYYDSTDTLEEAIKRAREVKLIHSRAGFNIRNWVSNSKEFLEELEGCSNKQTDVLFSYDKQTTSERVLGILWKPTDDIFSFSSVTKSVLEAFVSRDVRPTKRSVLRCIMSIFDPLGLLAPFTVHGKILMQDIWRSGCQWDQEIDDECFKKWGKWSSLLPLVEGLQIPRFYFANVQLSALKTLELHVFVDASEHAYGCAAYFRVVNNNKAHCSLVMAKTKVAPLKQLSIPRMELQAAVLGSRVVNLVEANHSLPISHRVLWTDSRTVLSWIQSDQRKYKQFVAFRIGEILNNTRLDEWRWVSSKNNIADGLTKWGRSFTMNSADEWFQGPNILLQPEEIWPKRVMPLANVNEELRASVMFHELYIQENVIEVSRISKWNILIRTIATCFRFISNCRRKVQRLPIEVIPTSSKLHKYVIKRMQCSEKPIQQEEFLRAENHMWRQAQTDAYADEMRTMLKNRELSKEQRHSIEKSSPLYTLSPFLDESNVIRMEGRLCDATLIPYNLRFPIILPRDHPITTKLIEHYHSKFAHGNNETVVNELRRSFRISNLRVKVRNVSKQCRMCRVRKCKPENPRMAALPIQRVTPYLRPFSFVGVDYCGPIQVVVGRRSEKRWIVVFTCFTVRAIHLEVACSLTTQSCLMAIRRFFCRRGIPREIFSDNGTNFVAANKQIRREIEMINAECADAVTDARLKWSFNPPSAPHMGGVWERMVRSVKETMYALEDGRKLNDEILLTTLAEVEEMINSRPLTYYPTDSVCTEALSPNHFLRIGPSNGQLVPPETGSAEALRDTYSRSQYLAVSLWKRWINEYLPSLNQRSKWHDESTPVKPGDLVFLTNENQRAKWIRGIVEEVITAKDGRVRSAVVHTSFGKYKRPVNKLAVIELQSVQHNGKADPGTSSEQFTGWGTVSTIGDTDSTL